VATTIRILYYFARDLVGQVWSGAQALVTALLVFIIVMLLSRGIVGTLRLYLPPRPGSGCHDAPQGGTRG